MPAASAKSRIRRRRVAVGVVQTGKRRLAPRGKQGGRPPLLLAAKLTEHILVSAADEFSRCGVDATSMESIARKARVSKRTIYARFPTKEALLSAVLVHGIETQAAYIAQKPRSPDPKTALVSLLTDMLERSLSPEVIALERLMLWARGHDPKFTRVMAERANETPIRMITQFLDDWGGGRALASCDNRLLATILFEACLIGPRRRVTLGIAERDGAWRSHIDAVVTLFVAPRPSSARSRGSSELLSNDDLAVALHDFQVPVPR